MFKEVFLLGILYLYDVFFKSSKKRGGQGNDGLK